MTDRHPEGGGEPNPGSPEAVEAGCLCPVIDNRYGKGIPYKDATEFWFNAACPLHGASGIEVAGVGDDG